MPRSNGEFCPACGGTGEVKIIKNILGVNVEPATINGGLPFLSSGILANSKSMVVGSLTNGPEIMMLTRAFIN